MKIKLMFVDDQTLIRDGLKSLCLNEPSFSFVGEASNGAEAIELVPNLKPDVILMDIRMPIMDGVEATKHIKEKYPQIKIIILTTFDDDNYIIKALQYGASGYLLKDTSSEQLYSAIKEAYNNHVILPGLIASKLTKHLNVTSEPEIDSSLFTEREIDIIRLLIKGCTNAQISDTLYLSIGTVKNYLSQIYSKLYVEDRTNAIIALKKLGF